MSLNTDRTEDEEPVKNKNTTFHNPITTKAPIKNLKLPHQKRERDQRIQILQITAKKKKHFRASHEPN